MENSYVSCSFFKSTTSTCPNSRGQDLIICYGCNVLPQFLNEALASSLTLFAEETSKKVIKAT